MAMTAETLRNLLMVAAKDAQVRLVFEADGSEHDFPLEQVNIVRDDERTMSVILYGCK